MSSWKWNPIRSALRLPIFYKVIIANSAMALVVICALLLIKETRLAASVVVLGAGVLNALLVRAALDVEDRQRQQRELFRWTLHQSEEERHRVAGAIRDGSAQRLAALALKARNNGDIAREASEVMAELCDTAETLQPAGMEHLGLRGALEAFARKVGNEFGIPVRLAMPEGEVQLDPAKALTAFRIIEDTVETVLRHRPEKIRISLSVPPGTVQQ